MSNDANNWLASTRLRCPQCQEDLWSVVHSPMLDSLSFYCDSCPRHAEISYYDSHYEAAVTSTAEWRMQIQLLESQLKPCVCGGHFRFNAARRCLTCGFPVIRDNPAGIDLWYWEPFLAEESPDPSDKELERAEQRIDGLARTADLWLDE